MLPSAVIAALQAVDSSASQAVVSATLKAAIEDYDGALLKDVLDAFPLAELESMTAEEVAERMQIDGNDQKVMLASRGTTGASLPRRLSAPGPLILTLASLGSPHMPRERRQEVALDGQRRRLSSA